LRLGVNPENCLVVEDNAKGVEAAQRARMFVLKVKSPNEVTKDSLVLALTNAERGQGMTEVG
jgi:beta-phosphoglucomutase-like phosphatase (HAD superfamily)